MSTRYKVASLKQKRPLVLFLDSGLPKVAAMAANVETYATEKDGSLQSSDAARVTSAGVGAARNLDQHRRDALARVDEAAFSSAQFSFLFYFFDHVDNIFFFFRSWFHVKVCCVAGAGFFTDA